MFDLKIDLSEAINLFDVVEEKVEALREATVIDYVTQAYNANVKLAQTRLNQSRNEYISALQIRREDQFTYSLVLGGNKLAYMIEMGYAAFDMKPFFAASPKAKATKSGGWFLVIPFKFRTTAANPISGNPGQLLPRRIYDLIRNSPSRVKTQGKTEISVLKNESIPQRYQPKTSVISEFTNKAQEYIPKSSIYAGLQRVKNLESGKSTYNTFRAVSNNSDAHSWLHPGIQAYGLMDEAVNSINEDDAILNALINTIE